MDYGACIRCRRFDSPVASLRCIGLLLAALTVTACGSPWYTAEPIEAWVVDAETGAPIEGAVVTANWQLVAPSLDTGGRKLRQLEVMETRTDKNGRFYFPGFTKINFTLDELRDEDPQILIFKSGYRYGRESSRYGADASYLKTRRKSNIAGDQVRLVKRDKDPKLYAFNIGFLTTYLLTLHSTGDVHRVSMMVRELACERNRLISESRSDAGLFSVPGHSSQELNCE